MKIGIDASRAFLKQRTGIEEYSYQVTKYLIEPLKDQEVVLYVRKNQKTDFVLPPNWKIKEIKWPRLWTQGGLALEMFFHPVDILFVPAHTVPWIHPVRTIVTIHGLEYEFFPKAYSWWERFYMRLSIKNSCRWASKIIAVSENTKKDLMKLYKVPENKISVVYEGINNKSDPPAGGLNLKQYQNSNIEIQKLGKYLLFIGRIEERKNIVRIIEAFEILKKKYGISHKLVLAGKPGFGFEKIKNYLSLSSYVSDVQMSGFVSEEEKWELLKNADAFVFATLYEGFGLPVLEAQSVGVPVVAGNNSSIPEVTVSNLRKSDFLSKSDFDSSAVLVDSLDSEAIAEAIYKLISDKALRNDIIKKGLENVKRFSWEKCAEKVAKILRNEK